MTVYYVQCGTVFRTARGRRGKHLSAKKLKESQERKNIVFGKLL